MTKAENAKIRHLIQSVKADLSEVRRCMDRLDNSLSARLIELELIDDTKREPIGEGC